MAGLPLLEAGLQVLVVDTMELSPVPPSEWGLFRHGDAYIVIFAEVEPSPDGYSETVTWAVHYWLGARAEQDKLFVAAFLAAQLTRSFEGHGPLRRELQGEESDAFLGYFLDHTAGAGLRYEEGAATDSALKELDFYQPAKLFRVVVPPKPTPRPRPGGAAAAGGGIRPPPPPLRAARGAPPVTMVEVPLRRASLRSDDSLILNTGEGILYIWRGAAASHRSRGAALELSFRLRQEEKAWEVLGAPREGEGEGEGTGVFRVEVIPVTQGQEPQEFLEFFDDNGEEEEEEEEEQGGAAAAVPTEPATAAAVAAAAEAGVVAATAASGGSDGGRSAGSRLGADESAWRLYAVDGPEVDDVSLVCEGMPGGDALRQPPRGVGGGADCGGGGGGRGGYRAFVLDCGSECFAWTPRGARLALEPAAMGFATILLARTSRPEWVVPTAVCEGRESFVFRSKFRGWGLRERLPAPPDAFFAVDRAGCVRAWSSDAIRTTGLGELAAWGRPLWGRRQQQSGGAPAAAALVAEKSLKGVRAAVEAAIAGKRSNSLQIAFMNWTGTGLSNSAGADARSAGATTAAAQHAQQPKQSFAHLVISPRRDAAGEIVGAIAMRAKRRQSVVTEAAANVFRKFSDREIGPMLSSGPTQAILAEMARVEHGSASSSSSSSSDSGGSDDDEGDDDEIDALSRVQGAASESSACSSPATPASSPAPPALLPALPQVRQRKQSRIERKASRAAARVAGTPPSGDGSPVAAAAAAAAPARRAYHLRQRTVDISVQGAIGGVADDGSGELQVWRIGRLALEPLPEAHYGHFESDSTYALLYRCSGAVGKAAQAAAAAVAAATVAAGDEVLAAVARPRFIIYIWEGLRAKASDWIRWKMEISKAALEEWKDVARTTTLPQFRIRQHDEPTHFLRIFKSTLVFHHRELAAPLEEGATASPPALPASVGEEALANDHTVEAAVVAEAEAKAEAAAVAAEEAAESVRLFGKIGAARAAKARFKAALEASLRANVTRADLDVIVATRAPQPQPLMLLMELMVSLLGLRPRLVPESGGGEYVKTEGGYRRWVAAPKTSRLDYWVVAAEVLESGDAFERLASVSHDNFSPHVMVRLQYCFGSGSRGGSAINSDRGGRFGAGMMPVALRSAGCGAAVGLSEWLRAIFDATAAERTACRWLTRAGVSLYHVRGGSLGDHRAGGGGDDGGEDGDEAPITPPYAVQAEPTSASVNSTGLFVAIREAPSAPNLQAAWLWVGKDSSRQEREVGVVTAMRLLRWHRLEPGVEVTVVREVGPAWQWGARTFWLALGVQMYSAGDMYAKDTSHLACMFVCSHDTAGEFQVSEKPYFSQEDLREDAVVLVHTTTVLFVWSGGHSASAKREQALSAAGSYQASSEGRLQVQVIKQGKETKEFKAAFHAWKGVANVYVDPRERRIAEMRAAGKLGDQFMCMGRVIETSSDDET